MLTSTAGQGEFPQNGRAFWDGIRKTPTLTSICPTPTSQSLRLETVITGPGRRTRSTTTNPAKTLDTRVQFLGGKQLTPIGLGDDQDPDTYQTGYQEWEARTLASTECVPTLRVSLKSRRRLRMKTSRLAPTTSGAPSSKAWQTRPRAPFQPSISSSPSSMGRTCRTIVICGMNGRLRAWSLHIRS